MLAFICLHGYQEFSEILLSVIFKFVTPMLLWASPQDTVAIPECRSQTLGETLAYL